MPWDGGNINILYASSLRNTRTEKTQQIAVPHEIPWISGKRQPPGCIYIYMYIYIYINEQTWWFLVATAYWRPKTSYEKERENPTDGPGKNNRCFTILASSCWLWVIRTLVFGQSQAFKNAKVHQGAITATLTCHVFLSDHVLFIFAISWVRTLVLCCSWQFLAVRYGSWFPCAVHSKIVSGSHGKS